MSSTLWSMFLKIPNSDNAKCILCHKRYSYKTSITNLKKHLSCKHSDAYEKLLKINEKLVSSGTVKKTRYKPRKYPNGMSPIWNHFTKVSDKRSAKCKICHEEYSYKTSMTNLKTHLRNKHKTVYQDLLDDENTEFEDETKNRFKGTTGNLSVHLKRYHEDALEKIREAGGNDENSFDSDAESESILQQDVYFEEENDQVKCTVCGKIISEDGEDPREHLEEHHPGLLARIIKNEDQEEEEAEEKETQNEKDIFTEIVYLDPITLPQTQKLSPQTKKPTTENIRKRKLSTNSDEYLIKSKKTKEIESFTNYVRVLLEKLPQEVCSRLQLEIINLIMAAQFNLPSNSTAVASTSMN